MNKQEILASMTPELVERFRTAIEIGKWPDGNKLTAAQRETCLQAVMIWEHEHLPPEERIGYIHKPHKKTSAADSDDASDHKDSGHKHSDHKNSDHEPQYPNLPNPTGSIQPVKFR